MTYDYEKGAFYQQRLAASDNGTTIHFDSDAPTGSYTPALQEYEIRLHGIKAHAVTIDGAESKSFADRTELESGAAEGWTTGNDRYGDVTFVQVRATTAKHVAASR